MAVTQTLTVPRMKDRNTRRRRFGGRRAGLGYLMVAPALILSLLFFVLPLGLLVVMSFFDWPLLGSIKPAGIANYLRAFSDPAFGKALLFTLLFTVVLVPLSLFVSYASAVMVRGTGKFVSFIRTAFFMPVVIGFTAAAYMTSVMLMPGNGVINVVLRNLGLSDGATAWFTRPDTAFWAIIVLSVWKSMGVAMILLMAGMQAVPGEVTEAAKIDGAGWWRREASIVFPLVRRQFALCLILAVSGTLLTFDQFFVLTKGGPAGSTVTAVMYTYAQSFTRYNLGYGAALSMIITAIILVIAVFQLRALRATGKELS